jgi:hypothetical protein
LFVQSLERIIRIGSRVARRLFQARPIVSLGRHFFAGFHSKFVSASGASSREVASRLLAFSWRFVMSHSDDFDRPDFEVLPDVVADPQVVAKLLVSEAESLLRDASDRGWRSRVTRGRCAAEMMAVATSVLREVRGPEAL